MVAIGVCLVARTNLRKGDYKGRMQKCASILMREGELHMQWPI